jgi:hypothetical protein
VRKGFAFPTSTNLSAARGCASRRPRHSLDMDTIQGKA